MDLKTLPPGWKKPLPETLARPTFWPAMLALGVNLILLGIVTQIVVGLAGLLLSIVSLAGWIGEIFHE